MSLVKTRNRWSITEAQNHGKKTGEGGTSSSKHGCQFVRNRARHTQFLQLPGFAPAMCHWDRSSMWSASCSCMRNCGEATPTELTWAWQSSGRACIPLEIERQMVFSLLLYVRIDMYGRSAYKARSQTDRAYMFRRQHCTHRRQRSRRRM